MQEKWKQIKIPPAWKSDEWVCHHSGNRGSSIFGNSSRQQSSRNFATPTSSKRISTAKIRRRMYISI